MEPEVLKTYYDIIAQCDSTITAITTEVNKIEAADIKVEDEGKSFNSPYGRGYITKASKVKTYAITCLNSARSLIKSAWDSMMPFDEEKVVDYYEKARHATNYALILTKALQDAQKGDVIDLLREYDKIIKQKDDIRRRVSPKSTPLTTKVELKELPNPIENKLDSRLLL